MSTSACKSTPRTTPTIASSASMWCPAFDNGDDYEIPDNDLGKWIKTNPKIHADKATAAHQAYSNEWKGLVRMVKYWNNNPKHGEKPVKPSFLIEVMALQCLHGGWRRQFRSRDPGLLRDARRPHFRRMAGPGRPWPADQQRHGPGAQAARARPAARGEPRSDARHRPCPAGRNGEALKAWRELFGPKFPLS